MKNTYIIGDLFAEDDEVKSESSPYPFFTKIGKKIQLDFKSHQLVENPGLLVSFYMMASYGYYVRNFSIIYDEDYDQLCVEILERFDSIDHPHKHLIEVESLKAGTGYALQYPERVINAYEMLVREFFG
jgi:hypothetical protein